jgi:threonine synthase
MKYTMMRCKDCGEEMEYVAFGMACKSCESPWLECITDKDKLQSFDFGKKAYTIWDYADLLPIGDLSNVVTFGCGGTPLRRLRKIGERYGLKNLFVKDERFSNTSSFKDRGASVTTSKLIELGVKDFVFSSTGNMGAAFSAYGAKAGINRYAFLPKGTPAEKIKEMKYFGTDVHHVDVSYDKAKKMASAFAKEHGYARALGTKDPFRVEAKKTIAFEIFSDLPHVDYYVQAISGGTGMLGMDKGIRELQEAGHSFNPKLVVVQNTGCSPMVDAFNKGEYVEYTPVEENAVTTKITTLTTGDPYGYRFVADAVRKSDGLMHAVDDEKAFATVKELAETEGMLVCSASATALAGILDLAKQGKIDEDAIIVFNCGAQGLRELSLL